MNIIFKHTSWVEQEVKRKIVFLDSNKIMPTGLGDLVENLEKEKFYNLRKEYPDEEKFHLLLRKEVFPYDWFTGMGKLEEKELPPKQAFYSKLNEKGISDEDYQHAQKVWEVFGCKTMLDYHNLYLKSDIIQLANVFEEF